jgi:exonuclease III
MSIEISTLNIFTLNDKNKIMFVRDFIEKYKIDICFIQETHIKDVSIFNFIKDNLCLYDFYSTISPDNTRGVAIFIRKERGLKVLNEYFDTENTVHGIEVCFKNKNYNFINIYSPTSSYNQCEFIQNLYTLLSSKKISSWEETSTTSRIGNMREIIINYGKPSLKTITSVSLNGVSLIDQ